MAQTWRLIQQYPVVVPVIIAVVYSVYLRILMVDLLGNLSHDLFDDV